MTQASDIAVIKRDLEWHFRIGLGAMGVFTSAFVLLITFYLPHEFELQRGAIRGDLDKITKLQLEKVSTQIDAAQKSGINVDQESVAQLGQSVLDIATAPERKGVSNLAWNVSNQVLGYYSSVATVDLSKFVINRVSNKDAECITVDGAKGWVFLGQAFEHCTQHLDSITGPTAVANGIFFKDLAFVDVRVIYTGGPLRLDNVYFVNCTFELRPSQPSQMLARTLLTENRVPHLHWPPP